MNKFKGNKNVSYVCSDKDIRIFNSSGRIIYSHPNRGERLIIFNLPDGLFSTKNTIQTVNKKRILSRPFKCCLESTLDNGILVYLLKGN